MKLNELLERLAWQENEMYNLYKLGETFATYEKPELVETFQILAEEELRHRRTIEDVMKGNSLEDTRVIDYLDELSIEPMLGHGRLEADGFEELGVGAIVREKHAYEMYSRLSEILDDSLAQIFRMMAGEELKHAYRLKLLYEGL